jgi:hypothetical protein
MTRWVRFAGSMINGTPILLVTLLLMVAAWSAAAEIYAAAIQIPGHGESAALVLAALDVVHSWVLVLNLAALVYDLQELRLPRHRQLLAIGLILIFGFIFVVPCTVVWSLHGGARDAFMIGMGSVTGVAGALLWRLRSRARNAPGAPISAAILTSVPAQLASPWRAVRVALGPPYAPVSWQRRGIELVSLCVLVAGAPILVVLYAGSIQPRAFPFVLHSTEFLGFMAAIGLCWAWPLSRLLAVFNPERGALTELALLPGLGSGGQQLRRLLLVALSVPAAGLSLLLISALILVTLQHLPHDAYLRLALNFLLVPLITLPILVIWLAKPTMPATWAATLFMVSQTWTFSMLVWSGIWDAGAPDTVTVRMFRGLTVGLVLAGLMIFFGFSGFSLRKILQRPHPFVEISS